MIGSNNNLTHAAIVVVALLTSLPRFALSQATTSDSVQVDRSGRSVLGNVFYTGQLDGFIGSECICKGRTPDECDKLIENSANELRDFRSTHDGILLGMGDNFGPFGLDPQTSGLDPYIPKNMIKQRLNPDYTQNPVVQFVRGVSYDAVVPGKEDFAWGVEYVRRMADAGSFPMDEAAVPFVANNLTIQAKPDPECLSYPTPTPALPLLPNQVSAPIPSAATGAGAAGGVGATAGGGAGASGGGGKGKGKGGGGGGGKGASAAGSSGGSLSAPGAASSCPGTTGTGGSAGVAAAGTAGSVGGNILTRKQQKEMNALPRPSLVWPDTSAVYPWTFSMAVTVPTGKFNTKSALMCPADPDPSKTDVVVEANCIRWAKSEPPKNTAVGFEMEIMDRLRSEIEHLGLKAPQGQPQHGPPAPAQPGNPPVPSLPETETDAFTVAKPGIPPDANVVPISPEGAIADRGHSGVLFPGSLLKLCLALSESASPRYRCTFSPIIVQRILFRSGWVIPKKSGIGHYVIFGALASDTLNGLSDANKDWAPEKVPPPERRNPTMQVNVGDPAAALTQAVTAFNLLHPSSSFTAVVLAQMTPPEAKSLADSLGSTSYSYSVDYTHAVDHTAVNLILSAADPVESTPHSIISLPAPTPNAERYIPVLSPAPLFQKADCLSRPLQNGDCIAHAELTSQGASRTVENIPASFSPLPGPNYEDQANNKTGAGKSPSTNKTLCDNQVGQTTWECRVLMDMRTAMFDTHPDWNPEIAILEAKDFDYIRSRINPDTGISSNAPTPTQAIEALWNAGNLTRVTLLGQTLTAILDQNRSNQSQTYQTIASVRQSQQLRILGIFQVGQSYYVNGIPLDSTKLYAVATSDNLATASSDYASLSSLDQNAPEVFWNRHRTKSIAEIVYLRGTSSAPAFLTQSQIEAPYRDPVTPSDRTQAAPQLTPFALSLTHSMRTIFPNQGKTSLSSLGEQAQLGSLWHIAIQQISVGFSNARPSQSDQLIGTNLGGVTNPNVVSPHSDTLSIVDDSRVERYFHHGPCNFCAADAGTDVQINFTRSIQGSTTSTTPTLTTAGLPVPTTSVSYPANTYVGSPFLEFEVNAVDFWKPIVIRPALVTANVAPLKQYLASGNTKLGITPNLDFVLSQKRTIALGEAIGSRFEWSDFSYVEFGFLFQRSYNILSDVFVGQTLCALNSSTSLSACAATLPATAGIPLQASYSNYDQMGGYMLGSLTQELPTNPFRNGYPVNPLRKALFLYQGTAFGNFFAYGPASSSSALTRYAFAMNNTLQVQLPANFAFGPSYNWFFFQANKHGMGASLHRSSISAQLNYSLDWHTGMSLTKALVGKTQ